MTRSEILDTAKEIVTKDRQTQYGDAEDNFNLIADLWTPVVKRLIETQGELYAKDVSLLLILLKVARATAVMHIDNYVDIIGYAACGGEIAGRLAE